jgi:hypothetical protein
VDEGLDDDLPVLSLLFKADDDGNDAVAVVAAAVEEATVFLRRFVGVVALLKGVVDLEEEEEEGVTDLFDGVCSTGCELGRL